MTEPLAACLGLCLKQRAGAMQNQQTFGRFHQVLKVLQRIKAGSLLHAGAAQCDSSVTAV